ncbi:MAG TPA: ABC transporter permease [Sporichthyaceae bacterium]|jgi:ABC-2 type transport system permease protein|nr:ABC transporter permease [Sporichthyaceae bacterium]
MSQVELTARAFLTVRRQRGAMRRLVLSEIGMVFRRRRNLALLALLAAAPLAIGLAVRLNHHDRRGGGPDFMNQVTENGVFLVFTALTITLPLLLPLLVGVVAGDSIAGEAGSGTLRYLLTVPVSRTRLLIAKAVGVLAYTAVAVSIVAVVGLVAGGAFFGLHPVTLLSGDTIPLHEGLLRVVEVTGYVILTLTGFLAVGLFISTLTEVPIAAMAATVGAAVVSAVLDQIPQLGSLRDFLFTHYWTGFGEILRAQVDWHTLGSWLWLQVGYVALFGTAAWARLGGADITS